MRKLFKPSRRSFLSTVAGAAAAAGFAPRALAYSPQCTSSNVPAEPSSLPGNSATPLGTIAASKNISLGVQLSAITDRSYGNGLYDSVYQNLLKREAIQHVENSTGWGFGAVCPDPPVNGQIVFTNSHYGITNTWYEANDVSTFCKNQ